MGRTLDCFCKGIESSQSQQSEEAIPDSYDKCVPRFTTHHGCNNWTVIIRHY